MAIDIDGRDLTLVVYQHGIAPRSECVLPRGGTCFVVPVTHDTQ